MPRAVGRDRLGVETAGQVLLDCDAPKGWRARMPATRTSAEHPGTALSLGRGVLRSPRGAAPGVGRPVRPRAVGRAARDARRGDLQRGVGSRPRARSFRLRGARRPPRVHPPRRPARGVPSGARAGAPRGRVQRAGAPPEPRLGAPALGRRMALARSPPGLVGRGRRIPAHAAPRLRRLPSRRIHGAPRRVRPAGPAHRDARRNARSTRRGGTGRPVALGRPLPKEKAIWDVESDATQDVLDRYHVLEPFAGLLPVDDQVRLAERFDFDALRWGRVEAIFLIVMFGPLALASVLGAIAAFEAVGHPEDRGLRRRRRSSRSCACRRSAAGRLAPSVLGVLVRPFARKLLA